MPERMPNEKLLELWKEHKLTALEKVNRSDLLQATAVESFYYYDEEEKAQEITRKALYTQKLLLNILVTQIDKKVDYWSLLTPTFIEPQKPENEPLNLISLPVLPPPPELSLPALKPPEISLLPSYSKKPILPNVTYEDMERHESQLIQSEDCVYDIESHKKQCLKSLYFNPIIDSIKSSIIFISLLGVAKVLITLLSGN